MRSRGLSSVSLGFTFAGCFLGAGYVSGRELWQFFGKYGVWGFAGLVISMLLLFFLGTVTLLFAVRTGETRIGELVIPWELPRLKKLAEILTLLFLYGVDCIMTAGVAALAAQAFHFSAEISGFVFSLLVAVVTLLGLEGMIAVFSMTVPILAGTTVILAVSAIFLIPGETGLSVPENSVTPGRLLFSAVVYAAYNMFGSVAILAPVGVRTKGRRSLLLGILLGTGILLLIAGSILSVLITHPSATGEELPMLSIAAMLSDRLGKVFALLLFAAMFGTSLSCFLTAFRQTEDSRPVVRKYGKISVFLLSLLVWLCSLFGFSRLIDLIYPLFGVAGSVFLVFLVINYTKTFRKRGKERADRENAS